MASKRLDILLVERGLARSREHAQSLILAGEVWTGERRLEKPGTSIAEETPLEVRARTTPFVSRAGEKLHHALAAFGVSVRDRVCLDVGASTGGFTDCLLQAGAKHVFAIDVGYGQLDMKLRRHEQVTVVEKTNARYLTSAALAELHESAREISFVCIDVSFISLGKVVEPLVAEFPGVSDWVLLFKPQFEVGPKHLGKGGIVRSQEAVDEALAAFDALAARLGLLRRGGPETSPLVGKKSGNVEYLVHYGNSQQK